MFIIFKSNQISLPEQVIEQRFSHRSYLKKKLSRGSNIFDTGTKISFAHGNGRLSDSILCF